jgi:hypothetical protein
MATTPTGTVTPRPMTEVATAFKTGNAANAADSSTMMLASSTRKAVLKLFMDMDPIAEWDL